MRLVLLVAASALALMPVSANAQSAAIPPVKLSKPNSYGLKDGKIALLSYSMNFVTGQRASANATVGVKAGAGTTLDQIADDLRRRDARDRERAAAPLTAAPDAVLIDTSALGRAEAIAAAIEAVERIRHTG